MLNSAAGSQIIASAAKTVGKAGAKAKRNIRRNIERLLTACGWLFEVVTVSISVIDVVSDTLVAWQFYDEGHMLWFWLVAASVIISSIVYSFIAVEAGLMDTSSGFKHPILQLPHIRLILYPLIFPFAQLVPMVNWANQMMIRKRVIHRRGDSIGMTREDSLSEVVREELEQVEASAAVIESLEQSIDDHLATHGLFFIETIVESIPQSVIQLLAVTSIGSASVVQVVSMMISLFSIVSKAYMFSNAYDMRIIIFKFCLVAHDVFSLFYVFSTLAAKDEVKDVYVPGMNIYLTDLGYEWLARVLIVDLSFVSLLLLFAVTQWYRAGLLRPRRAIREIKYFLMASGVVVTLAVPIALVLEGAKLFWVAFLTTFSDCDQKKYKHLSLIYSFIRRGESAKDRTRRLKTICIGSIREERNKYQSTIPSRRRKGNPIYADRLAKLMQFERICTNPDFRDSDLFWKPLRHLFIVPTKEQLWTFLKHCNNNRLDTLLIAFTVGSIFIYTLAIVHSLAFPFRNAYYRYATHNALQWGSFFPTSACALMIISLLPTYWSYACFIAQTREILSEAPLNSQKVAEWIEQYHVPPHGQLLIASTPKGLVPPDVLNVVADYMQANDVVREHLSITECNMFKRLVDNLLPFN